MMRSYEFRSPIASSALAATVFIFGLVATASAGPDPAAAAKSTSAVELKAPKTTFLKPLRARRVRAADIPAATDPNRRLVDICRALGADTYLAGAGAAAYMDLGCFARHGLRVQAQEFRHPVYPQRFKGFISHLSVVDLLFNCGPESADIIRRAGTDA